MSTATPRTLTLTEEDLKPRASYDDFEDGEYVGTLTAVEDINATTTDNTGWKWIFQVQGLDFNIVTWLKGGGLWKVNEVLNAFGDALEEGTARVDPTRHIGKQATVIIKTDPDSDRGFQNVTRVLPVAEKPELSDFAEDMGADPTEVPSPDIEAL